MPKRKDIKTILVIGAGPIVIGQGCEFDYSGTQAIKALKEEGYRVVLINSNPATIMTDPQFSDKTYIEPISAEYVEAIIKKEKPDAILPTVGGQTALNVAMKLDEEGILKKYNVELIGANRKAIETAESREMFKQAMLEIGLDLPYGYTVKSLDEAKKLLNKMAPIKIVKIMADVPTVFIKQSIKIGHVIVLAISAKTRAPVAPTPAASSGEKIPV